MEELSVYIEKIKYYEAVSGEERFLFMDGFFNMTYEEYSAPYVEPPEGSIILFKDPDGNDKDSTTIYNEFMALVKKHASTSDYYHNNFNANCITWAFLRWRIT